MATTQPKQTDADRRWEERRAQIAELRRRRANRRVEAEEARRQFDRAFGRLTARHRSTA